MNANSSQTKFSSPIGSGSARSRARLIGSLPIPLQFAGCLVLGSIGLCGLLLAQGCDKKSQAAPETTLTLMDQSWVDKESQARLREELTQARLRFLIDPRLVHKESQARLREELTQFTKDTGIQVQILPAPEVAVDQLQTWRNLLESRTKVPDVYGIDVIWPGSLADNLLDLKAYVPKEEIAAHFPELIKEKGGRL